MRRWGERWYVGVHTEMEVAHQLIHSVVRALPSTCVCVCVCIHVNRNKHAHTQCTHVHTNTHTRTCLLADTGNRKLLIAAVARMRMVSLRLDSNCRGTLQAQSLPSKKAQRTLKVRSSCPLHTPLGVVSTPRSQSAWSGAAVESVTRRGHTSEQPPSSQTPLPAGQK